jgi:hypothetical protein
MKHSSVIVSQYLAALEMLKETIVQCPDSIWDDPNDKTKVWQIAYHALFYTHLYLQETEEAFTPWSKHRQGVHSLGQVPKQQDSAPETVEPYEKETVLEYLAFCQQQVAEIVPQLNLEAASGFHWLPFGKFELQFYTIRHIQQHTGELMERLGTRADLELPWVGMRPR